jgi:hypothetical protein
MFHSSDPENGIAEGLGVILGLVGLLLVGVAVFQLLEFVELTSWIGAIWITSTALFVGVIILRRNKWSSMFAPLRMPLLAVSLGMLPHVVFLYVFNRHARAQGVLSSQFFVQAVGQYEKALIEIKWYVKDFAFPGLITLCLATVAVLWLPFALRKPSLRGSFIWLRAICTSLGLVLWSATAFSLTTTASVGAWEANQHKRLVAQKAIEIKTRAELEAYLKIKRDLNTALFTREAQHGVPDDGCSVGASRDEHGCLSISDFLGQLSSAYGGSSRPGTDTGDSSGGDGRRPGNGSDDGPGPTQWIVWLLLGDEAFDYPIRDAMDQATPGDPEPKDMSVPSLLAQSIASTEEMNERVDALRQDVSRLIGAAFGTIAEEYVGNLVATAIEGYGEHIADQIFYSRPFAVAAQVLSSPLMCGKLQDLASQSFETLFRGWHSPQLAQKITASLKEGRASQDRPPGAGVGAMIPGLDGRGPRLGTSGSMQERRGIEAPPRAPTVRGIVAPAPAPPARIVVP